MICKLEKKVSFMPLENASVEMVNEKKKIFTVKDKFKSIMFRTTSKEDMIGWYGFPNTGSWLLVMLLGYEMHRFIWTSLMRKWIRKLRISLMSIVLVAIALSKMEELCSWMKSVEKLYASFLEKISRITLTLKCWVWSRLIFTCAKWNDRKASKIQSLSLTQFDRFWTNLERNCLQA